MVNLAWLFISLGGGLVVFFLPALLAPSLGGDRQHKILSFYEWLTAMSYWRPTLVRRELGGYTMTYRSPDREKKMDEVEDAFDISDPDDRINRWQSKPLAGAYGGTPVAVDADLAELGEAWHEHVDEGKAEPSDEDADINTFARANDEMQLADLANAYHVIPNDADPSDAETVQSYVRRAMAKYGGNISMTEALVGILGLLGGLGSVVMLQNYILDGTSSSGGGDNVTAPVPIGQIDVSPLIDTVVMIV